jgi:5-methylcytosine-specific restriction endonuclease McrA
MTSTEYMRIWRARNPGRHAANMRAWRADNPERAREISREANRLRRATKHEAYLKEKQSYYDKCRRFIVEFFGGCCAHCGFTDFRALQMDHIERRGEKEIRLGLAERYLLIRDNPEQARQRFQLLCANCNSIKRFEKKEYANGRGKRGNGF